MTSVGCSPRASSRKTPVMLGSDTNQFIKESCTIPVPDYVVNSDITA